MGSQSNFRTQSMTCFAQSRASFGTFDLIWKLRAVNHRGLDLKCRLGEQLQSAETEIRQSVRKTLLRGSVEVSGQIVRTDHPTENVEVLFTKLKRAVAAGSGSWFLPAPLRAIILARYPRYWLEAADTENNAEIETTAIIDSFSKVLEEAVRVRESEGYSTVQAMAREIGYQQELLEQVKIALPEIHRLIVSRLSERLDVARREIGNASEIMDSRLGQECAVLLEKRDVSEEVTRLAHHLSEFQSVLTSGAVEIGRRSELLCQELHREWNTLNAKIPEPRLTQVSIEGRLSVEKIREQSLNLV